MNTKPDVNEGSAALLCHQPMIVGLRRCIGAAFEHEESFLDRFWNGWRINMTGLHECYMASERTKIVVLRNDGGFATTSISTDDFLLWVDSVVDG